MSKLYKINATGEALELNRVEVVKSYPEDITVYVLSDGSRWCAANFLKHLSPVDVESQKPS